MRTHASDLLPNDPVMIYTPYGWVTATVVNVRTDIRTRNSDGRVIADQRFVCRIDDAAAKSVNCPPGYLFVIDQPEDIKDNAKAEHPLFNELFRDNITEQHVVDRLAALGHSLEMEKIPNEYGWRITWKGPGPEDQKLKFDYRIGPRKDAMLEFLNSQRL
jgi:hypothetical protein